MSNPTPAQEEFAAFLDKNTRSELDHIHPEDRDEVAREAEEQSEDEEDRYRASKIEAAMRMPTMDAHTEVRLPPPSFDMGRSTGVKGVIADARSFEAARRTKWKNRVRAARRSVFGVESAKQERSSGPDSDGSGAEDSDEEAFLQQWRESRRRELEEESRKPVRNRRTSPSVRLFGRFDHVDALGYLDAIEKVGRDTVVVVFVYDHEVGGPIRGNPPLRFSPLARSLRADQVQTVRSLGRDRVCHDPAGPRVPGGPLRQGALRGHRVRQRRRAGHPRIPEPGRPLRQPDRRAGDDTGRRGFRHGLAQETLHGTGHPVKGACAELSPSANCWFTLPLSG